MLKKSTWERLHDKHLTSESGVMVDKWRECDAFARLYSRVDRDIVCLALICGRLWWFTASNKAGRPGVGCNTWWQTSGLQWYHLKCVYYCLISQ